MVSFKLIKIKKCSKNGNEMKTSNPSKEASQVTEGNGETLKSIVETKIVLKVALDTLNNIPNHKGVGPNGQSSYEVANVITKYLRNNG